MEDRITALETRIAELEDEVAIQSEGTRLAFMHAYTHLVGLLDAAGSVREGDVRDGLRQFFLPNPREDMEEGRVLHQLHELMALFRKDADGQAGGTPDRASLTGD
jgi:hypothetical protein